MAGTAAGVSQSHQHNSAPTSPAWNAAHNRSAASLLYGAAASRRAQAIMSVKAAIARRYGALFFSFCWAAAWHLLRNATIGPSAASAALIGQHMQKLPRTGVGETLQVGQFLFGCPGALYQPRQLRLSLKRGGARLGPVADRTSADPRGENPVILGLQRHEPGRGGSEISNCRA
jgi:hypothetical protein